MRKINDADQAIEKITKGKLSSYGIEEEQTAAKQDLFPSAPHSNRDIAPRVHKPRRKTYSAPKRPVMSREDWIKMHPEARTPSVMSKGKTDETLLACQELPTPDQPIKGYAGYTREEWDKLLYVVARYMADVVEGAGLIYKGGLFCPDNFRDGLSLLLQQNFSHHDPYDQRPRSISVDGRIDTDERKP